MQNLDKGGMGSRIKQIRKKAGLRQWQLAQVLGTTQSAVHKYEHGVIPEPRRLVELSRLGNTTIEWILTGRHWQNGSDRQERPPEDVFRMAERLQDFGPEDRQALSDALRIMKEAADAARRNGGAPEEGAELLGKEKDLLEAALRVHRAVMESVIDLAREKLVPPSSPGNASQTPEDRGKH